MVSTREAPQPGPPHGLGEAKQGRVYSALGCVASPETLTLPCSISLSDTVLRNEACSEPRCRLNTGLVMMEPASDALPDTLRSWPCPGPWP